MKNTSKTLSILLALLMIFSVTVSAAGGNGGGNGNGTGGGGGNNPLSFVSATADGKNLQDAELASSGSITITFDRGMTDYQAANFEQIGIYDKDGKKAEGVTFTDFTKDDAGNSFTVLSYKDLPSGEYTLKLGKDLKANNDNTLGKAVTITFTVKAADSGNEKVDFIRTIINAIMDMLKAIVSFFQNLSK